MQYDSIILELMSRIKTLEGEVSQLKEIVQELQSSTPASPSSPVTPAQEHEPTESTHTHSTSYTKTTDAMIDLCYVYGKEAYQHPGSNLWSYADKVSKESGMNRNSAFMYICGVKNLLEGSVYKRAMNAKALRKYFSAIYADFGKAGLEKAISSARKNIDYRTSFQLPSDSSISICEEFEAMLR